MDAVLKIFGAVEKNAELDFDDLSDLPPESQIADVRQLVKDRQGKAICLKALLDRSAPRPEASHITFRSQEGFVAGVPLRLAYSQAIVVYKTAEGDPLPLSLGGPFRLFIPGGGTSCDNVKGLYEIEVTTHQEEGTVQKGEPEVRKFVKVAVIDEIPVGTGKAVENHDKPIALFHTEEGFFAINHVCPHRGGPLGEGTVRGMLVTCPWHGWRFNLQTGSSERQDGHSVATYEVRIEGKDVLVGWLKKS
jgi:NAD(P)H-dependent nitrite reductase small subunit